MWLCVDTWTLACEMVWSRTTVGKDPVVLFAYARTARHHAGDDSLTSFRCRLEISLPRRRCRLRQFLPHMWSCGFLRGTFMRRGPMLKVLRGNLVEYRTQGQGRSTHDPDNSFLASDVAQRSSRKDPAYTLHRVKYPRPPASFRMTYFRTRTSIHLFDQRIGHTEEASAWLVVCRLSPGEGGVQTSTENSCRLELPAKG